jgi:hypothetical protein
MHTEEEARGVLTHRKGERKQPRKFRKLGAAVASLLVVSVGLFVTLTEAANPSFVGRWFTLYEEEVGSDTIYKIAGKVAKITATGVKTAKLDIQIRVTNNHDFGVHLTKAYFVVTDKRVSHVVLSMNLPDTVIPAYDITTIYTECTGMKLYGMGYRFLVIGVMEWNEIYDSGAVSPTFTKEFHEVHSPSEYFHGNY